MRDLLTALALMLVIEGVLYAAFPDAMRRAIAAALALPQSTLRTAGLVAAAVGVAAVWAIRS